MKNFLLLFVVFNTYASIAEASCVLKTNESSLARMSQDDQASAATLIQNIGECKNQTLQVLKLALEKSVSSEVVNLDNAYKNIPSMVANGTFTQQEQILVNREAIKLARRTSALALIKSEINERKIKVLMTR